jgi:hypothetical protein
MGRPGVILLRALTRAVQADLPAASGIAESSSLAAARPDRV